MATTSKRFAIVLVVALALLVSACGSSAKKSVASAPPADAAMPWPAPPNPMELAVKAGLVPETAESLQYHVHAHLDVFIDGKKIVVPGGIGIDTTNPGVHSGEVDGYPAYGGISTPCDKPCISPLHTHDATGVLHTESATRKNNTLGEFFIEWDVKLTKDCVGTYCAPATPVAFYVGGTQVKVDPTTIPLANANEIAIVIGTPPAQIPSTFDLSLI